MKIRCREFSFSRRLAALRELDSQCQASSFRLRALDVEDFRAPSRLHDLIRDGADSQQVFDGAIYRS